MNLSKIILIALLVMVPFSSAAAREKLVVGQPAPACLNIDYNSAQQDAPPVVLTVFLRGLF